MDGKKMWIEKIMNELNGDGIDEKTASLVYFFIIGLKGKRKKK